jgi:hypothetical protein
MIKKKWFIDYLIKDTLSIVDELTHKILQLKANELATQNALKR